MEISVPAYKFNSSLFEGLAAHDNINVSCIVSNTIHQKVEASLTNEDYKSNKYVFLKLCKGKLRHVKFLFENLKYTKKMQKNHKDTVIVCDALNITSSIACVLSRWLYKACTVAIVTDLPQYVGLISSRSLTLKAKDKLTLWAMSKFSAYVLLTEAMNAHVNKFKRPYCIIEGFCNIKARELQNDIDQKHNKITCVYAGAIHEKMKIAEVVQAFNIPEFADFELNIYGRGTYVNEITALCEKSRNAKYLGTVSDSEILSAELKATLLINPRPSYEEYTKYVFPSKVLEYMVSGTPVLTTKLSGMPKEYYDYVYFIEDESVGGIRKALRDTLTIPRRELHEKGLTAREFVLKEKNNIVQAKKILDLINSLS